MLFRVLLLTGLLLTPSAGLGTPPPILALLTGVKGDVRVQSPDRSQDLPARARQALSEGDRLVLAKEASVTLLCHNAAVRRLDRSFEVTPKLCQPQPGEAAAGLKLHLGSLELVGEARGEDRDGFDRRPVLISPRCPEEFGVRLGCHRLLSTRPPVRWLEVAGAQTYRLELTGPEPYEPITLRAADADCSPLAGFSGRRACSLPWPAESWRLVEDQVHRLEVIATCPSRTVRSGKTLLQPLSSMSARQVRQALDNVSRLRPDTVTRIFTQAVIYTGSGLAQEAVRVLELSTEKDTASALLLGDAYLLVDLPELALSAYQKALATADHAGGEHDAAKLRIERLQALLENEPKRPSVSRADGLEVNWTRKRALVVAIAEYAPSTRWQRINSDNDIPLIEMALIGRGFERSAIHVLRDRQATREGILNSFERVLLHPARPGDLVVFHYSGHGQQLTDDNGDELDGYDETLVPYNAPATPAGGYGGKRHLRDDVLHLLLLQLRRKIGPTGHVIVTLDSCFSGTPRGRLVQTRGGSEVIQVVRGGQPLGPPQVGSSETVEGSGLLDRPRGRIVEEEGLAPYVVFSAAAHNELVFETTSDQGTRVGSLTYALTRELAKAESEMTYRHLLDRVRWLMARRVSNRPQVEGDLDTLIFNGETTAQAPYVEVISVESRRRLTVAAGSLVGLSFGAQVEVHREGAARASVETLLSSGEVVESTPFTAVVELAKDVERPRLERGRVFVTQAAFGELRVRVQVLGFGERKKEISQLLRERARSIRIVEEAPDLLIYISSEGDDMRVAVETVDGVPILGPLSSTAEDIWEHVRERLRQLALNWYLRELRIEDPELRVEFTMIPVRVDNCTGRVPSPQSCRVTELDLEPTEEERAEKSWRIGEWFKLRVINQSQYEVYPSVLDLLPDGRVGVLWPAPRRQDKTPIPSGEAGELSALYQITGPIGEESLLLIASEVFTEWHTMLLTERPHRAEPFFATTRISTRIDSFTVLHERSK